MSTENSGVPQEVLAGELGMSLPELKTALGIVGIDFKKVYTPEEIDSIKSFIKGDSESEPQPETPAQPKRKGKSKGGNSSIAQRSQTAVQQYDANAVDEAMALAAREAEQTGLGIAADHTKLIASNYVAGMSKGLVEFAAQGSNFLSRLRTEFDGVAEGDAESTDPLEAVRSAFLFTEPDE